LYAYRRPSFHLRSVPINSCSINFRYRTRRKFHVDALSLSLSLSRFTHTKLSCRSQGIYHPIAMAVHLGNPNFAVPPSGFYYVVLQAWAPSFPPIALSTAIAEDERPDRIGLRQRRLWKQSESRATYTTNRCTSFSWLTDHFSHKRHLSRSQRSELQAAISSTVSFSRKPNNSNRVQCTANKVF